MNALFLPPLPLSTLRILLALILALPIGSTVPGDRDESGNWPESFEMTAAIGEALDGPLIKPDSTLQNGIKYAGKFHLIVLHFPIAFLLAGSFVQW